jgi:hypothetical protein
MNSKGSGKRSEPISRCQPSIFLEELLKTTNPTLRIASVRDSNPTHSKYETGMPTTGPRNLITFTVCIWPCVLLFTEMDSECNGTVANISVNENGYSKRKAPNVVCMISLTQVAYSCSRVMNHCERSGICKTSLNNALLGKSRHFDSSGHS